MRVLLVPYPGSFRHAGGHVTQIVETQKALGRAGLDAEIAEAQEAIAETADIVHAFGDIRPLLALGVPGGKLVASPIYFPRSYVFSPRVVCRSALARHRAKAWLRYHGEAVLKAEEQRRREGEFADMLTAWGRAALVVVNSEAERELLLADAPRLRDVRVAYSGVEEEAFDGDAAEGRRLLGLGDEPFVLSVARIEPIKNHLSLACAVRPLGVRLVLVGEVLPGNEQFLAQVKAALPDVVHLPRLEHAQLRHVHAAASAHALPSWYETTGLSTLEALAAGRPVAVAGGPCVQEYFSGCASFCDSGSVRSIRRAVERALEGPLGCERDRAHSFSWERTARELLDAYAAVLHAV